jgi:hypothetical protein
MPPKKPFGLRIPCASVPTTDGSFLVGRAIYIKKMASSEKTPIAFSRAVCQFGEAVKWIDSTRDGFAGFAADT